MADQRAPRGYRFAVFDVDRVTGELKRAGLRVRLQGKPFELLIALLEANGDLVTRESLHERLWPGTVVDFEGSLNAAIKRLRDALQDSADTPRYIETIPRRGYRMLVPVEPIGAVAAGLAADAARTERPPAAAGSAASGGAGGASVADDPSATATADAAKQPEPLRRHRFLAGVAIGMTLVAAIVMVGAVLMSGDDQAPDAAAKRRLLVLPFENLSGDPDETFFSDGLTEEMITQLGRLNPDKLGIIARTTAMRYRGATDAIATARAEHGIDYALEGAVRRDSGRLRVSAKLIDATEQTQLWAANYDRDMRDVLALQSDLALEIAGALALELLPSTARRLTASRTVDPLAFEAVLKGQHHWAQQTGEGFRNAGAAFHKAIEIDPDYAAAYAGLANTWATVGIYDFVRPREAFPKAREAAERALALDPTLAEAHAVMGLIQCAYDWDCTAAEQSFRKAIELDANNVKAHHWLANLLAISGRPDESAAQMDIARQLDPLSRILNSDIGWNDFFARRYDQAIAQLEATLELDPYFMVAHDNLAWVYFQKGDLDRYIEHSVRALELSGDAPADIARYRAFFEREGWQALRRRSATNMARRATTEYVSPYDIALEWSAIGERDEGLRWLAEALEQREIDMMVVHVDPRLDALREDPRFSEIASRVVPRGHS